MTRFTTDHQRRAGWGRARQWARWRVNHPSTLESLVRDYLTARDISFIPEYEITHDSGMPQWIDIYIPDKKIAIEIDGSHGWHGYNGSTCKMAYYDELKARYCEDHGITLLQIRSQNFSADLESAWGVISGTAIAPQKEIPF